MRPRITFANVASALALFIALGGTALATHPGGQDTISTADIINGEVKVADVGQGAVATEELKNDAVTTKKIANGEVRGGDVLDATLTGADVANNSLKGADIDESTLSSIGGGGPAGGDLTGTYPNPLIGPNAVAGGEVADGSLSGSDIDESSLAQVPNAALGGIGRWNGLSLDCDPGNETFITCDFVTINLPASSRVLITASANAYSKNGDDAHGTCRLATSFGTLFDAYLPVLVDNGSILNNAGQVVSLTAVSPLLSGPADFGIECNQQGGNIAYRPVHVTAVALSPN